MRGFANRPPGTLWVPAFVMRAEGFSPTARVVRQPAAAELKPSARLTKPYGLETYRAKTCIIPSGGGRRADTVYCAYSSENSNSDGSAVGRLLRRSAERVELRHGRSPEWDGDLSVHRH
jgi:hypothetical protein